MSEQQTPSRKALVVLGVHRSGTSAMARVLGLCGATLPVDPHQAGFDNPEGFWESRAVIALDDEILAATDSEWDDVFAGRPRHYLSNFDRVFSHKAGEALAAAFGDGELIVLKDPRINVLAGFWDRALRSQDYEPTYVVMVRHPLEVAASLRKRNGLPTETGLLLWLDHMCAAERDTRGARRVFVGYPDLLSSWRTCVDRVEAAAGVPLPRRTSAASNEIGRFLNADLRHHQADPSAVREFARAWPRVNEAYAWFLAASCGEEPAEAPALRAAESHLGEISATVGPVVADLRARLAEHRKHIGGLDGVVADLRATAEGEAARATEALTEQNALRRHAEALEAERSELRSHAGALEGERTRLEHALTAAADQAKAIELTLLKAEADLTAAHAEGEAAERDRNAAARAAVEREEAVVATLRDTLAAEQGRLAEAREAAAEQTRREAELDARRAQLERALLAAAEQVLAVETAHREAEDALALERGRLADAHATNAERSRREDELESHRAEFAKALATAAEHAQAADAARLEAEAALAAERERPERSKDEPDAEALRHEREQAVATHERLGASLTHAEAARVEAEAEVAFYSRRCDDLRGEVLRLQSASEAALSRTHDFERDLASARVERDRLAAAVAAEGRRAQASRAAVAGLEERLQERLAQAEDLAARLGEADRRRETVEAEAGAQIAGLLAQREALLNSTAWRLTSVPRRLLSRLRGT